LLRLIYLTKLSLLVSFLQADSRHEERDSRSPSPRKQRSLSRSRSRSRSRSVPRARSRSRSRSLPRPISPSRGRGRRSEVENPGTTLYVTGLSTRVTDKDLEAHFSKEGKVASCFLVMEPRTRESRGFAFVTMDTVKDADRCIKYLNQSVLEGRYITVERLVLATIKDDTTHPYPNPTNQLYCFNSQLIKGHYQVSTTISTSQVFMCFVLSSTEMAVAVEGGTVIVIVTDTVGHQDATIHLVVVEGGHHQDVSIHLVAVEEVLEEIGLTLLMEEAQREGPREGINPVRGGSR
ncbi:unnamed protein product, partial [Brassica rapa]